MRFAGLCTNYGEMPTPIVRLFSDEDSDKTVQKEKCNPP